MGEKKVFSEKQQEEFITLLKGRFKKNMQRHTGIEWESVEVKLYASPDKLWSLQQMESTDGEPDVIGFDKKTGEYIFCDCAAESPKGRRSVCYDRDGLDSRKEFKPADNAVDMCERMGIEMLTEETYMALQAVGNFDSKTSSWLQTPADIRKLGGAIFGDYRYGKVFVYHNGAQSYYASRGFRGLLRL